MDIKSVDMLYIAYGYVFHVSGVTIKFSIFLRFVVFNYLRRPNKHLLKIYRQRFVCSVILATDIQQVLI
jgi:hypothetical protein